MDFLPCMQLHDFLPKKVVSKKKKKKKKEEERKKAGKSDTWMD